MTNASEAPKSETDRIDGVTEVINELVVNPDRAEKLSYNEADRIIVLAED